MALLLSMTSLEKRKLKLSEVKQLVQDKSAVKVTDSGLHLRSDSKVTALTSSALGLGQRKSLVQPCMIYYSKE